MKVRNSLKSLRGRHRNNRLVRRKGRVYVINKVQRRFKARHRENRLVRRKGRVYIINKLNPRYKARQG